MGSYEQHNEHAVRLISVKSSDVVTSEIFEEKTQDVANTVCAGPQLADLLITS